MKILKFLIVLIGFAFIVKAQKSAEQSLLNSVKDKLNSVNDYVVSLEVSVDMDFLRMPKSKAKLFYKSPDKFRFQSSGFAILPKTGIEYNPQKILKDDYKAEFVKDTVLSESYYSLIKISPQSDSAKFDKAYLLVDTDKLLLIELNLFPTENSNVFTKFKYGDQQKYALPSELAITFNYAEKENTSEKRKRRIPENFSGKVNIKYKGYKVNEGIDDSVFNEESGDQKKSLETEN